MLLRQGSALADAAPTGLVGTRDLGSFRILWGFFLLMLTSRSLIPVTFFSLSLRIFLASGTFWGRDRKNEKAARLAERFSWCEYSVVKSK